MVDSAPDFVEASAPATSAARIELNGRPPTLAELAFLAQLNYGHFTSLQVRERSARGFEQHLKRLASATWELFGSELDVERTRALIRQVLTDAPASLRVTVFSQQLDRSHLERPVAADVLVATSAPRQPATSPLRLQSIVHERVLPQVKHVGTFGLFHHWRQARLAGFDDVLFTTTQGEISEGSIWNIGFWDGARVIWPNAPALPGVTRQLLDLGLRARGIATETRHLNLHDLAEFRSAFVMNSGSVGPLIESIDEHRFVMDPELVDMLVKCYESQPLEPI